MHRDRLRKIPDASGPIKLPIGEGGFQFGFCGTVVKGSGALMGAFCKGMKSETSVYPVFEVILRKTLEQLRRFLSSENTWKKRALMGAFCKGKRSETSVYPVFEVTLRKTLEQLCRLF